MKNIPAYCKTWNKGEPCVFVEIDGWLEPTSMAPWFSTRNKGPLRACSHNVQTLVPKTQLNVFPWALVHTSKVLSPPDNENTWCHIFFWFGMWRNASTNGALREHRTGVKYSYGMVWWTGGACASVPSNYIYCELVVWGWLWPAPPPCLQTWHTCLLTHRGA